MQINRYPVTIDGETTHIGTAGELAIALDVLQGQRDRDVLAQLRIHLADIMGGPQGFARTLTSLSPDDQIFLIDAIGARLAGVIREARFLRDIFATMAVVAVERKMLTTLGGDGLRALVPTAEELAEILEWLYGECDQQAIELIGTPHLRRVMRHALDLAVVLNALDANGKRDLLDRIGWANASALLRDGIDLALLLRALPTDLSARLLGEMTRERIVALIGNPRDWEYLWQRLEPAEGKLLAEKLGVPYAA
ncbi:MAG: hypothetical protein HY868_05665 [Chloroflexi bacterium]|nr:hypothetical protein [Chloroflexota bacterium]